MRLNQNFLSLEKAEMAFRQQDYENAVYLYTATLPLLEQAIDAKTPLSATQAAQFLTYSRSSLLYGLALGQSGKITDAKPVFLRTMSRLVPFIDNLCNPVRYRALLITEYKRLFYALASYYASENRMDQLRQYVSGHQSMLSRWTVSLQVINASTVPTN